MIEPLLVAFWLIFPAYVAMAVWFHVDWGRPVDFGRTWRGSRLLGDHRTVPGTVLALGLGMIAGFLLNIVVVEVGGHLGFETPTFPLLAILALPIGAILGHAIVEAFFQVSSIEENPIVEFLERVDYAISALSLCFLAVPGWFVGVVSVLTIVIILVLTPILHVGSTHLVESLPVASRTLG